MSKEMEPQGIIFQLEWKKKTGHSSRDEVASIGIWDTMDNSLDWTTFRSYLCQNLGTMEDISVAYVDSEGDELPIESECEFQEALKYARHRARKGREIVLKLDGQGVPLSQAGGKTPAKVRESKPKHAHKLATKPGAKSSSVEKIRNSIVQASLMRPIIPMHRFTASTSAGGADEKKVKLKKHTVAEDDEAGKLKKVVVDELTALQELLLRKLRADWDDSPPQWFKKYMQKVKSEIIAEVTTNVLFANRQVVELVERRMQEYGTPQSATKKPRKKKKNGSDEDSDCPQDSDLGSSKLLKKLEKLHKQEKKLDSKLEKLETKTKRRMEKKSLQQPLERKVSSAAKKKCGGGGSAGPYLMDAIILHDDQQTTDARALVGTAFAKVWEIMNNGTLPWTDKTELRLTWGTPGLEPEETAICCPILNPGEKGHISINFKPPDVAGTFETYWHFYHMGKRFGHWLCCAVVVDGRDTTEPGQKAGDEGVEAGATHSSPAPAPVAGAEEPASAPGVQLQDQEAGDYNIYDDNSDSLTFMSDVSTDLASEEDDNFVVVPMPACFKCDVPLTAIAEGSEASSSNDRDKCGPDTRYLQELLGNNTHQNTMENGDKLARNINKENGNEHDDLEKVIMDLGDFTLDSGACSHLDNEGLARELDGAKAASADKELELLTDGEAAKAGSVMGDGVYVVDGSGHCTLVKKDPKYPDNLKSVFVFGSNGRLLKKNCDVLRSSGKSKVGSDKKVYVVNDDGSCSLLDSDNPSASEPIPDGAKTCKLDDVPNFPATARRMFQFTREGVIQYFRDGNDMKSLFRPFDNILNPPVVGENISQNDLYAKLPDGTWKTSRSSGMLSNSTTAADDAQSSYLKRAMATSCYPNCNNSATYSLDVGVGSACSMGSSFTNSGSGITTTRDNSTVFTMAGANGTGFTNANSMTESLPVSSNIGAGYPHNCPLVRTFGSAEVGLAPAVNSGACFTVPDIGVGFSPMGSSETGMALPGLAPVTFTTAGNPVPGFSASGVASTAVGSQRAGFLPSGTGEAYIIDPKVMNLPQITNTLPVPPGEARAVNYYVDPGNYYEPLVFDDRFFAGPQAVRFGMQPPPNPDNNPAPLGNPENYFEPACCGPTTQPAGPETGSMTVDSKQGGPTVDITGGSQCRFDPTTAGCRPLLGHVAAFPPPPAFSFVPAYRPYNAVPPSPVPVGSGTQLVEATPVQPVRLFPQGLLPVTLRTASSVLNGVSSVLRTLSPWGRQDYIPDSTTANLIHLQEMGFLDYERNVALLHQYGNDLNRVVTELLAERESSDINVQQPPNICLV